jgi:hypothetical protein
MAKFKIWIRFSFIAIIVFTIACEKKEPLFTAKIADSKLPDNITYYDLNPDDSVQSVNYFYQIQWTGPANYCNVPFPTINNVSKNIDYNNDGLADFKISANHESVQISANGCPTLKVYSRIMCLIPGDSLLTGFPGMGNNNPFPYPFQYGDTIKEKGGLHQTTFIHEHTYLQPANTFSEKTYIGLKRQINNKTHYGWLLVKTNYLVGIKVYAVALNNTPGKRIKAGQTE